VAAGLLLGACTVAAPTTTAPSRTTSAPASRPQATDAATIICEHAIDGLPPTPDVTVVLDAVDLPASPAYSPLQAADSGGTPRLFAKTGLLIRAGVPSRVEVPASGDPSVGIGWSGWPAEPGRAVVVPGCPDLRGTGWLSFAGGYWADEPLCLPLDVRTGDRLQRVEIGIGTACAGQAPPPG
jgi:hypothetical protein